MNVTLSSLEDLLTTEILTAFLVFLRVGAIVGLMPAIGETSIPARVKLVAALVFSLITVPAITVPVSLTTSFSFIPVACGELLVGLFWGLMLRLFVIALQIVGSIAAQSTSLAQILGGAMAEPIPAMGYFLVLAGLTLAMTLGLHIDLAVYLIDTYKVIPIGEWPEVRSFAHAFTSHVSDIFALSFSLAAPFVIASLIYNLALGVISRAMPQLMVAFVGAPFLVFAGLFLMFSGCGLILIVWHRAFVSFLSGVTF